MAKALFHKKEFSELDPPAWVCQSEVLAFSAALCLNTNIYMKKNFL